MIVIVIEDISGEIDNFITSLILIGYRYSFKDIYHSNDNRFNYYYTFYNKDFEINQLRLSILFENNKIINMYGWSIEAEQSVSKDKPVHEDCIAVMKTIISWAK